ncbi:MAG: YncE family protein [Bacteroidetes bacterium]|nr:YncE family protein [Bacteroidota bacterium]
MASDIPLPGGTSRFDYQTVSESQQRLYISHMGADLVTVFDLASNRVVGNISDIPKPTGIVAVPQLNRVYVSASAKNKVYVVNATSFKAVQTIPTGSFPDEIAYDPEVKRAFVSCEFGGVVTVFDASTNRVITNIRMGGHVGNTHFDAVSKMIYSTNQTHGELIEIDPKTLHIVARYHLDGCKGPHGFYIDSQTHYAFITGEDNATYVVFNLSSKRIIARGRVGEGPDVLAFDRSLHRLYVASESGVLSVFDLEKGAVKKIGKSFFAKNAHTVSVDQKTHRVFFPLQDVDGAAVLRVMEPIR